MQAGLITAVNARECVPVAERWLKVGAAGALGGAACVRSDAPSLHGPEPLLFAALTRTV